jgi:hypothetical protein
MDGITEIKEIIITKKDYTRDIPCKIWNGDIFEIDIHLSTIMIL